MLGLRGNISEALAVAGVIAGVFLMIATALALKRRRERRAWVTPAARVLFLGFALAAVVATGYPRDGLSSDGDLVLVPGGGGLGDIDQIIADPSSLTAVSLLVDLLSYVPVGFFGAIGSRMRRALVLMVALGLSVGVQAAQFFVLGRVATIDDVILNFGGALLGVALASVTLARLGSREAVVRGVI